MAQSSFTTVAAFCALMIVIPSASAAEPQEEARSHYQRGARAFHDGRYDEAARAFQSAYDLDPRGPLLLNIAQAYRLRTPRDCAQALRYYELFLAAQPDAPEKSEVTGHIAQMRTCVKADEETAARREAIPAVATPAIPTKAAPAIRSRAAPWLMGAGLATAALGGGLYLAARDRHAELSARCPCPNDASAQDDIDRWESVSQASYVLSGVGLATLVGGAAWWLWGVKAGSGPETALVVHPVLFPGGAAVFAEGALW